MKLKTPWIDLVPPLSTSEFEVLKADIEDRGVLIPVDVDEDGNILDGHHRYQCDQNAPTRVVAGMTDTEKRAYVIRANVARRNLSPDQRRELSKEQAKICRQLKAEDKTRTQKQLAVMVGVSQSTVRDWLSVSNSSPTTANTKAGTVRDHTTDARVKVAPKAKKEIAERVAAGEKHEQVAADYGVSRSRVTQIAKQAEKIHTREDDKARKTAHLKDSLFDVRKGDFREVLTDVEGVTLVLTDPPYVKEALNLWEDLAEWAADALADDGMLIAYSGQLYLPIVLDNLSKHLDYWWCGAVVHAGSGNLTPLGYPVRKVVNQWKPLVMFYKPGGCGWQSDFRDLVSGTGPEKEQHNWQQPVAEAGEIIKRFTKEGDLVVDPFAGSGGFCKAAHDLGRKAIGAEIL